MSDFYQFTGRVNSSQNLVWVRQTTIASDGSVTVSSPSSSNFEVESDGTGKVEIEWDDIVDFASSPAVLLTIVQSSGDGSRATPTVMSLSTGQAEIQTVKSGGDNANRAFSFLISGYS